MSRISSSNSDVPAAISRQTGQSLVLVALILPVLLGFVGLSIDYGTLASNRRMLQNAADAAALAGAQDLVAATTQTKATTDATSYLTSNGYSGSGNDAPFTITPSPAVPAATKITVTVNRTVPLNFFALLGKTSEPVSATAIANVSQLKNCDVNAAGTFCFPYVAWHTYGSLCTPYKLGDILIFHENSWVSTSGANTCGWTGNSNNEDGYVRPNSGTFGLGVNQVSGGNSCGQEPIAALQAAATADEIIYLPVGAAENSNGSNLNMTVTGFVGLRLRGFINPATNQLSQVSDYSCPGTFYGQVETIGADGPGVTYQPGCDSTVLNTCIIRLCNLVYDNETC